MTNADVYFFGSYRLDTNPPRLTRDGVEVDLGARHLVLLAALVSRAGETLSKNILTDLGWPGIIVTINSLDQAILAIRRTVALPSGEVLIETVPRRGFRFVAKVRRSEAQPKDDDLDAVMTAHRAWIEGRAGLETLESGAIVRARVTFEDVVARMPRRAPAHVGLAKALALQFEMTRTDAEPDIAVLQRALEHATTARRLDPSYGEAWATLGFVLERAGRRDDGLAAAREAIALEPDNWRHHLRLAAASWGEERLREARRTLTLLPGLAMAHWLAASVLVARGALGEAERELRCGLENPDGDGTGSSGLGAQHTTRFSAVALHWLLGLLLLARGDRDGALREFDLELALEGSGHLYARECAANTWYAIGATRFRDGDRDGAHAAFLESVKRVPKHPSARAALGNVAAASGPPSIDRAIAQAVCMKMHEAQGGAGTAAAAIEQVLAAAPQGNAGWLLPVEPILGVARCPERWMRVLARLRSRAA